MVHRIPPNRNPSVDKCPPVSKTAELATDQTATTTTEAAETQPRGLTAAVPVSTASRAAGTGGRQVGFRKPHLTTVAPDTRTRSL